MMLDKRTSLLLAKINELCAEGGFKIVEEEELLSCFPEKYGVTEEELSSMVKFLSDHRYIDVRYAEADVYCLCPLPEGRMYFENVHEANVGSARRRRDTVLFTFLGAFFGALLGSALCVLLIFIFR